MPRKKKGKSIAQKKLDEEKKIVYDIIRLQKWVKFTPKQVTEKYREKVPRKTVAVVKRIILKLVEEYPHIQQDGRYFVNNPVEKGILEEENIVKEKRDIKTQKEVLQEKNVLETEAQEDVLKGSVIKIEVLDEKSVSKIKTQEEKSVEDDDCITIAVPGDPEPSEDDDDENDTEIYGTDDDVDSVGSALNNIDENGSICMSNEEEEYNVLGEVISDPYPKYSISNMFWDEVMQFS